jgi:site-specific recombinase XerD
METIMQNSRSRSLKTELSPTLSEVQRLIDGWILDGKLRQLSERTLGTRRDITARLIWFLNHREYPTCGTLELKQFIGYVATGHTEPGGRWNNPRLTKAVRPRVVKDFHNVLTTFWRWAVDEGYLDENPMECIKSPIARADQIRPFSETQISTLLNAAQASKYPERDFAVILFMLDTGVRSSELCGLTYKDLDIVGKKAWVRGKGDKHRAVYFGRVTGKALWQYLRQVPREPSDPVFLTERNASFSPNALGLLFDRLGRTAQVEATRCSPHTMRHTFAVTFLRAGGNVFSLQQLLGHTELKMTQRYVSLAQADVENQHRLFSPADALRGGRK